MATTLALNVVSTIVADYSKDLDLGDPSVSINDAASKRFSSGVATGECNRLYADTLALTTTPTDLDLTALVDALGDALNLVKVKVLRAECPTANVDNVVLGGAAANAFLGPFNDATDKVTIPPGGWVEFVHPGAGWTVTAGTGDILRLVAAAGTPSVDLIMAGTDA